jgi:hypothetical protein
MINLTPKELPPTLSANMSNAYFKGSRIMKDNIIWGIPFVAFEAATCQNGEAIPTLTGRLAGLAASPFLGGAISAGLVGTIGCPPAAAAVAAMFLACYVSTKIEDPIIRGFSYLSKAAVKSQRASFGGDYQDTVTAQKRRQRAIRDIVGVMPQARQWLGQESLILHR